MSNEKMNTVYASELGVFSGEQVADLIVKGQKKPEDFTQVKLPMFYKLIDTRVVAEKSTQPSLVDSFFKADKSGKLNRIYNFIHHKGNEVPKVVLDTMRKTFIYHKGKCNTTAKMLRWKKVRVSAAYIKHLSHKHGWVTDKYNIVRS